MGKKIGGYLLDIEAQAQRAIAAATPLPPSLSPIAQGLDLQAALEKERARSEELIRSSIASSIGTLSQQIGQQIRVAVKEATTPPPPKVRPPPSPPPTLPFEARQAPAPVLSEAEAYARLLTFHLVCLDEYFWLGRRSSLAGPAAIRGAAASPVLG